MKDIQVTITNVTEKRMAVMPDEDMLMCTHPPKLNYETQALYEICKLGYVVIKMEWRAVDCNGHGLYVTFGKLVL